MDKTE